MFRLFGRQLERLKPSFRFQSIRRLSSPTDIAKHEVQPTTQIDEPFLNPDWYRTPQASDGPRCIAPDYPETEYRSYQLRDPYKKYTGDQQLRTEYGEPLDENCDILSAQSFDVETTYSIRYMLTSLAVAGAVFVGAVKFLQLFDHPDGWRTNAVPRQYPNMNREEDD